MAKPFRTWFKKYFMRDLAMTKQGFSYFLIAFIFLFIGLEYAIVSLITIVPINLTSISTITFLLSIGLALVVSGFIVDRWKNRMQLLVICAALQLIGLILLIPAGTVIELIGYAFLAFWGGIYLVALLTTVTHESTILNRGRLYGYMFFFAFIIGSLVTWVSIGNPLPVVIVECFVFVMLIYIYGKYSYIETEQRLKSELRFRDVIKQNLLGYLTAFLVLGYILGNAFPLEMDVNIDPTAFIISCLLFFIISGTFLDNMGRKWSFTGMILILSALIIFAGVFQEGYSAIFLGISLASLFITLFTFAGDFSTERNTLKYRARILSMFIVIVVGGFIGGLLSRYALTEVHAVLPDLYYWIPDLINGMNSMLLIVVLVWIMPLPELLSAKEADWAGTLRNLYIFNRDSICLFAKSFLSEDDAMDLPPEDLITGGLTGILTLVSEITSERTKNLRIIDKDRVKIYFAYGKKVIVALISTKFLPLLFRKMEIFTKAFERKFETELTNFRGKINVFLNNSDSLVSRYFK